MTSKAQRRESWWRRNMTFTVEYPGASPMHSPRPAACVCPCASCFSKAAMAPPPRPQSYLYPVRPTTSISGTSATLSPPRTFVSPAVAQQGAVQMSHRPPRIETPSWESKRSSIFSVRNLLRRKSSMDTLASDFVPLRSSVVGMGRTSIGSDDGRSELSVRY